MFRQGADVLFFEQTGHAGKGACRDSPVSPSSRVILTLHYVDGLPLAEAAEELDVSLGTVKSRLAYGLVQLRGRFGATRS